MKCQEELARAIVKAKGTSCEAAKGLKELEERRKNGEDVILFPLRGRWIVGPREELRQETATASSEAKRKAQEVQQRRAQAQWRH